MKFEEKITKINVSAGQGKYSIDAEVLCIGEDILVSVWGGTKPHIGSVVMSIPRPSLKDPNMISTTSSVFNCTGHKDEAIARLLSENIAAALNRLTIATAGFHIDTINKNGLRLIMKNAKSLSTIILKKIGNRKQ